MFSTPNSKERSTSTTTRRLVKRFLVSGFVGLFVALTVYVLGSMRAVRTNDLLNPYILLMLAPGMILGLADPHSTAGILMLFGIVFGTNFLLYGVVGVLLWEAWSWLRRIPTP
jgi:hypothetical protein